MGHMVRKAVVLLAAMAISVSGTMRGDSTRDGLGRHWSRRHFEAERRCRTTLNSRRLKRNVGVLPSDHCLRFPTKRVTTLRLPSGKVIWDLFLEGFGPLKTVAAACDEKRRKELERDFVVFHDRFRNDLGVAMPREYLVSEGVRK